MKVSKSFVTRRSVLYRQPVAAFQGLGTPVGLFITSDDMLYIVDGRTGLRIANTRDGSIVERIEGLFNPHAVTVDKQGAIYVAEIDGTNVKTFVKK